MCWRRRVHSCKRVSLCPLSGPQGQHVFSPVLQSSGRMMAPPTHGQPSLVSSSTTQYPEQTHTMYGRWSSPRTRARFRVLRVLTGCFWLEVSPGPMPQQYPHPSATLHPHPQHPQPSATPTGQGQQGGPPQHGGPPSHPAASPVQHQQHQQAAAGECGSQSSPVAPV